MKSISNKYIHYLIYSSILLLLYTSQYIVAARKQEDCPKSSNDVFCIEVYDPVTCGDHGCEYSNQCFATAASSNFTDKTCNLLNSQSTSAATSMNREGKRYVLFSSLFAVVMGMFAIGDDI